MLLATRVVPWDWQVTGTCRIMGFQPADCGIRVLSHQEGNVRWRASECAFMQKVRMP